MTRPSRPRLGAALIAASMTLSLAACSSLGLATGPDAVRTALDGLAKKAGSDRVVRVSYFVDGRGKTDKDVRADFVRDDAVSTYSSSKYQTEPLPTSEKFSQGQVFSLVSAEVAGTVGKGAEFAKQHCTEAGEQASVTISTLHDGGKILSLVCRRTPAAVYELDGQQVPSPGTDPVADTRQMVDLLRSRGIQSVSQTIISREGGRMKFIVVRERATTVAPLGSGTECTPGIAWGTSLSGEPGRLGAACVDVLMAPWAFSLTKLDPAVIGKMFDQLGEDGMVTLSVPMGDLNAAPYWNAAGGKGGVSSFDLAGNPRR